MPPINKRAILVGEADADFRSYLEKAIRGLDYLVELARDGNEVLSRLESCEADIVAVILDLRIPSRSGIDTLREIRTIDSSLPVIMLSSGSSSLDVVAAMKNGATDFLEKPVSQEQLAAAIVGAIESRSTIQHLSPRGMIAANGPPFVSTSPRMRGLQALVGQIGQSGAPVLIQGETGSGKEVLARELHAHSARADRQFLKLNCAALPSELVESELFGYERGAFTDAFQRKKGKFEQANGGSILLDEIGDMDVRLQAKLLQVLQDQQFLRIGGKETVQVDVRIMAATHRNLENAIQDGTFREDLYYRLNVINLLVPPLRDRKEDIIPLCEFFMRKHSFQGSLIPIITDGMRNAVMEYDWPGNVRELENFMRKLVVFRDADVIAQELRTRRVRKQPTSIRAEVKTGAPIRDTSSLLALEQVTKVNQQAEIDAILAALNSTRWNRKQASILLNVDYKSLLYKMKKLGLEQNAKSFFPAAALPHPLARTAGGA